MSTPFEVIQQRRLWTDWYNVPPVFIVGCGRSGTTLLRLMLSAHPKVSISSEGAHIYALRVKFPSYGDLSDPENLQVLYQDVASCLKDEMFLSPPAFEHLLDWVRHWGANERSIITFYGTWEARVLGKQELLWWGDNAPYHVYNYPYFDRLFPNSKFILLIRDPRDVYASGKVSFEWGLESVYWRWELALLNGLLAETQFGSTRVKRVMYERLVTVPQEQLQEICSFLGIDYTEEMLRFYESDAAKSIAQLGHHTNLLKPAFTSAIGKFRQVLTKEEIAAIEDRLNTPMESLGYLTHEEWERITLEKLSKSSHAAG